MANKAFKTTCGDLFKFDPDEIAVEGKTGGGIWDPRWDLPVLESLVLDIMIRGVAEPIIVGKNDDGQPYVIDGRQRVKAAREAKTRLAARGSNIKLRIPAVYQRSDNLGEFATMIAANEHRQDDDPLAKAKKLERFLAMGGTEREAAIAFGVSLQTIKNWSKLIDVAPEVKKAVKAGKIGATAAGKLADLPRAEQVDGLAKLTQDGHKPTVRRAVKVAKKKAPEGRTPRVRSRAAIELAIAHGTDVLHKMNGEDALWWVLGSKEVEGLEG
jgi:ParB-like chromosome segregation protein Spo0J